MAALTRWMIWQSFADPHDTLVGQRLLPGQSIVSSFSKHNFSRGYFRLLVEHDRVSLKFSTSGVSSASKEEIGFLAINNGSLSYSWASSKRRSPGLRRCCGGQLAVWNVPGILWEVRLLYDEWRLHLSREMSNELEEYPVDYTRILQTCRLSSVRVRAWGVLFSLHRCMELPEVFTLWNSIAIILVVVVWKFYKATAFTPKETGKNSPSRELLRPEFPNAPRYCEHEELCEITSNFKTKLGRGGFSTVFAGVLQDGNKVAVKRLESAKQGLKKFEAEVRTVGSTHHRNLVKLQGYGAHGQHYYLVYEFVEIFRWISGSLVISRTSMNI
ncbi:hypothetical protein SELMODRAFT_423903 [Selaginella moellendorffii]|uniref:Protein kinase domain-containing protein n=1 Tax=Selaginella moellendorffii TaxID=88036 RepID=D8SN66_SELML|nr:hypothetical protein SELMODRAFT_423903 [Selaginella moellendorffii]